MPRLRDIAFALAALLILTGCLSGRESNTHSRGAAVEGFGPITFGMSMEQAFAAIQGNGRIDTMQNQPALYFIYYLESDYAFDAWVTFGSNNRAQQAVLMSRDAPKHSDSYGQCQSLFNALKGILDHQYGPSDYRPREHGSAAMTDIGTTYTFADSSNMKLKATYIHPTSANGNQRRCDIKLMYLPQWVSCEPGSIWCDTIKVYPRPYRR